MRVVLVCSFLLFGVAPLVFCLFAMRHQYRRFLYENRMKQIDSICEELSNNIGQSGYLANPRQPELAAAIQIVAEAFTGRAIVVNSGLIIVQDTDGRDEGKTIISERVARGLSGEETKNYDVGSALIEVTIPIVLKINESEKQFIGVLNFVSDANDIAMLYEEFTKNTRILFVALLVIIFTASVVVAYRSTRSLSRLAARIDHITQNYDGTQHLNEHGYYEVEQISEAFERMMTRVEATEKSRQEFVSSVSHELKTPLTAIKVLSDSLVLEPNVPIEMYQEFIVDINSEIDREAKIVNDLLDLVKLDKTAGEMHIEEVNINQHVETIMRRLKPLALKRGIEMTFESYRVVNAQVDELKLSLVFTNLIENAIKYNRDGGRVMVSLNADHRYFYVRIEDTGIGIPEEERDLIFDRFYRVDKARSRESGGTGLGLAITKNAVQMHRGKVKVESVPGVGSIFTVRIPLSIALDVQ